MADAQTEYRRRLDLWNRVKGEGAGDIEPRLLRDLGVYGGAQGIWVDKVTTGELAPTGATVALLHTGEHYPDDLSGDGLLYHYPDTARPGKDDAEIGATKAAGQLGLPVFVVLRAETEPSRREVKLAWVADWDDSARQFLVLFGEDRPPYDPVTNSDAPFSLTDERQRKLRTAMERIGQAGFRFQVLRMYGCKCAVCPITHRLLLQAAHICGKKEKGSDDWRNGLPLCGTHHEAFDANLFAIVPRAPLQIEFAPGVLGKSIGVVAQHLSTLRNQPHLVALTWRYERAVAAWRKAADN